MTPCSNPVLTRIEKITKNQVVNPGSSPYNQMPENNHSSQNNNTAPVLAPENMRSFVAPKDESSNAEERRTVNADAPAEPDPTPDLIPNSPTFTVPANPLLPPGYQEVLDYNAIQYVNGFYRTQIGRYVRVEQLMGSNTVDSQEGFLIGVGINYIILQEAPTGNILIVDIYGIKNMYVYYTYRENYFAPLSMSPAASTTAANMVNAENPAAQTVSDSQSASHLQQTQK